MAKKPTVAKTAGVNVELLAKIAAATANDMVFYISQADAQPLMEAGLIEVNTSMLNDIGEAASRVTEKGAAMVNGSAPDAAAPAPTSAFGLITNAEVPKVTRSGGGGGQKAKYPFEHMEIGHSFYVSNADVKGGDAMKTLSATVANWNEKFKEPTGETKTVTRVVRGKDRKAVIVDGVKQMETVTIPKKRSLRKFVCRNVQAGKAYGGFTAPADGVLVSRVAVD